MNNKNEIGPNGERESNFRRDVRQALDMHPLDRDERIVAEVKMLKEIEQIVQCSSESLMNTHEV